MLALRLVRGTRPLGLIGRLLVACAAAGVGFLLLGTLSYALAHPDSPEDSARLLLWCVVPLAAAVQFATAVACSLPGQRSRSALDIAGMGPSRMPLLAAVSTAAACLLGSTVALLVYLHLRGDLTGLPFDGAALELLAADRSLPVAAALTLLCLTPAAAAVTAALVTRARAGDSARDIRESTTARNSQGSRDDRLVRAAQLVGVGRAMSATAPAPGPGPHEATAAASTTVADPAPQADADQADENDAPDADTAGEQRCTDDAADTADADSPGEAAVSLPPAGMHPAGIAPPPRRLPEPADTPRPPNPAALPWGVALAAAGLAWEMYAGRDAGPGPGDTALPLGAVVGFLLVAAGLVLTGPGLVHLTGRLLTLGRPGALRLLSGRALQQDAGRMGRPLGVLAAVAAGGLVAAEVHSETLHGVRDAGPLPVLGAALVVCCAVASALTAAAETHDARTPSTAALVRLGASKRLLWLSVAVRAGALAVVLGVPAWALGLLAALPLM